MQVVPLVSLPEGRRGPWAVRRVTVDRAPMRPDRKGPPPGTYTMLTHDLRGVVMSDTPDERRDHLVFVLKAHGHVLINGLGLGMCLAAVLARSEVTRATVVEADEDVIALVGRHYVGDPRVEIVHADAYDYAPPRGVRYGAVWHDIWDAISSDNLPGMTRLHRKYGRRTDWQGSWARDLCESGRRR
jgi:hypothetical protein